MQGQYYWFPFNFKRENEKQKNKRDFFFYPLKIPGNWFQQLQEISYNSNIEVNYKYI